MARIEGIDLPRQKRIEIALTYIFGIGHTTARRILDDAQVDYGIKTQDLSEVEVARIREVIQRKHKVEGELRKEIAMNIKRLIDIGCYRGMRHKRGLPVRGQNTRNNAHTRRSKRRTSPSKKKG